jgi:hypothetical protein
VGILGIRLKRTTDKIDKIDKRQNKFGCHHLTSDKDIEKKRWIPTVDRTSSRSKTIRNGSSGDKDGRGRQGNLESALRALDKMNIYIGILQETKITDENYTKKSFGYRVIATKSISAFQGGIVIAYRTSEWWSIESVRLYHPNVISFTLVTGKRRYLCVEAYIPPGDTTTIDTVYEAIERSARNTLILLGDLNADLMRPRDYRANEVAAMTATFGLEDLMRSFRQRISFRGHITWSMQRGARTVSS